MKLSQLALLLQFFFIGLINATQCPGKCGNVTIHYPFGIKEGCYMDKSYFLDCDSATQVPRLNQSFSKVMSSGSTTSLEVLEVNLDGHLTVNLPVVYTCYNKSGKLVHGSAKTYHMSRFPFSSTLNTFVGVGWYIKADIRRTEPIVTINCQTIPYVISNESCIEYECCKSDNIPTNMTYAHINVKPTIYSKNYITCGYGFLVEKNMFSFNKSYYRTLTRNKSFPVKLEWSVGNTTCEEARKDEVTYMCQDNSVCVNGGDYFLGYRCKCADGFSGNGYIPNGCQDVNECESPDQNDCLPEHCNNTYGSYTCVCPKGFHGSAKRGEQCTRGESESSSVAKGISEGVAGAALTMVLVYCGVNRRRKMEVRKDFFKQNGGIMLQKMLTTCKDNTNEAKIFTEEDLKNATDNFKDTNVIGQGGHGTVYKGILTNKTIVAIKKSKVIDQNLVNHFVNEVMILSKIHHPNVVKLLGCCLETHVPLLVYEYVPNNTLCHHIHTHPTLTLQKRLNISCDIAEALSHLHSSIQIIHRDVKPSNILLNDDFTAKVSDFGISTFVPPGQTHLSTFVKGTMGYVDPEYFRTHKLTDKSDVYSFGVVLVELLTGTNIHSLDMSVTSYKGLAAYLVSLLEQNALVQILYDPQLKRDEYSEVVKCVAKIAISCLDLEGKIRPTMKEIKQELQQLRCLMLSM